MTFSFLFFLLFLKNNPVVFSPRLIWTSLHDSSRRRGTQIVKFVLLIDCFDETVSCFSLTLKRMFSLRVADPCLFNSVDLNFLRTEALSFYKVPFVVCFCIRLLLSQDRLPFVRRSGGTPSRRPPPPPRPPRPRPPPVAPLPPFSRRCKRTTPAAPVPGREGHDSGGLLDIITQEITSPENPSLSYGGEGRGVALLLNGPAHSDCGEHRASTQPQRPRCDCVARTHFYTCGGFLI